MEGRGPHARPTLPPRAGDARLSQETGTITKTILVAQIAGSCRSGRGYTRPTAGALAEALDAERGRVCAAYGVRHRTLPAAIDHFYGTSGSGVHEAILNCAAYQSFGPFPSRVWRDWEAVDVPFAIVPLVRLAEQAGIGAPLHRAVAEIFGALLGIRPWSCRPTLEDMALEGAGSTVARRFLIG